MIVTISGGARATVLLLILTALARGQMFDFEGNIDSWGRSGTAFDRQPVSSRQILSDTFATVKVGGDYWRTLKYPLGQHGEFLISTRAIAGDRPVGTLTSPTFSLPQTNLHFSFLIGGTSDIAHERLELQVRVSSEDANELGRKIDDWALRTVHTLPVGLSRQDQDFLIVMAATGRYEQLSQEAIELPAFLASPRQVRLKLDR